MLRLRIASLQASSPPPYPSYPLQPLEADAKPAPACTLCDDTGIRSFWHDLGAGSGAVSSEVCVCQVQA